MISLRTGEAVQGRIMGIETPHAGLRWIRMNSRPMPGGAVTTFGDVSDQERLIRELRSSRDELQAILDSVPARISAWNADMTNRYSQVSYMPTYRDGAVVGYHVLAADITALRNSYERIRDLAQRLETIREEERRSVARMLHEVIAQDLAAAKMSLERLQAGTAGAVEIAAIYTNLNQALSECIERLRRDANDLRPAAVDHLDLRDVLNVYASQFASQSGLRIGFTEHQRFPVLDPSTRLLFFRAAEEGLTNVHHHAHATRVDIVLRVQARRLRMEICDDGVGIPDGAVDKPGCFGLLGMRERFNARGGGMSVGLRLPTGTQLAVSLPKSRRALEDRSGAGR
jgi:signal transduction histidine kinase